MCELFQTALGYHELGEKLHVSAFPLTELSGKPDICILSDGFLSPCVRPCRQTKDQTKKMANLKHKEQLEKSRNAQLMEDAKKREDNLNESSLQIKVKEACGFFHYPPARWAGWEWDEGEVAGEESFFSHLHPTALPWIL